jgi:hypothetical protein
VYVPRISYTRILERWYFGLCWNLRLVLELWKLGSFVFWFLLEDFFGSLHFFAWWDIWISIILFLPYSTPFFFNVNGKARVCHTTLIQKVRVWNAETQDSMHKVRDHS